MSDEKSDRSRISLTPPPLQQAQNPMWLPVESAALLASEEVGACCRSIVETVAFTCQFNAKGERRTAQGYRRALGSAARRFEGWKGIVRPAGRVIARELRCRAAELPRRPRGRPRESIARLFLDVAIVGTSAALKTAGAPDKADSILTSGHSASEWDNGRSAPSGLNTMVGVATVLAECAGVDLPPRSLQKAADNRRRAERRRQKARR